tara:strand:- start:59 stop:181 length:123 start_codon:yes stop_codon:yes gene_type:complete
MSFEILKGKGKIMAFKITFITLLMFIFVLGIERKKKDPDV